MKKIIAIILVLTASTAACAQSSKAKQIDAYVAPFVKGGQFSGVILASENGKIIYEKAFGMANADFKIPNRPDTRIGIASITKLMTVIILNRLIEEKKIALDDKLSKYIPDFPSGDKITVLMLRRHRSGILHRVMPPEQETIPYTSAEFVEKVKQSKLAFEPDTRQLYSSGGYAVLARAMEIASGKTYAEMLQQYVFDPAGMKDSLDFNSYAIMDRRAQDYLLDAGGPINAALKDYSFLVGAGSVFSTAHDVHKFGEAVLNGVFGDQVKTDWLTNTNVLNGSGQTNGHRSYFEIEKEKKYGYVILSNMGSGAFDAISTSISEILQGKELSIKSVSVPKLLPSSSVELTQYLGKYDREEGGGSVVMAIRNNTLYAGDIKLYPTGPDAFFEFKFFGNVRVVRDEQGKVKQVEWVSPGVKSTWVRQQDK